MRAYQLPVRDGFATAHERWSARRGAILALEGEDGVMGLGDIAPLPLPDGAEVRRLRDAAEQAGAMLKGVLVADGLAALRDGGRLGSLPSALAAAFSSALYDLSARASGRPLCRLLSAGDARSVPVNAVIGAGDAAQAARQAEAAVAAGFSCLKLKVGLLDTTAEVARVAAVRAAVGPRVQIRLDANGAWSVHEAVSVLTQLEAMRIELVEQPVRGAAALAEAAS